MALDKACLSVLFDWQIVEFLTYNVSFFNVFYSNNAAKWASNTSGSKDIQRHYLCYIFELGLDTELCNSFCQVSQDNCDPFFRIEFCSIKAVVYWYLLLLSIQKFSSILILSIILVKLLCLIIRFEFNDSQHRSFRLPNHSSWQNIVHFNLFHHCKYHLLKLNSCNSLVKIWEHKITFQSGRNLRYSFLSINQNLQLSWTFSSRKCVQWHL